MTGIVTKEQLRARKGRVFTYHEGDYETIRGTLIQSGEGAFPNPPGRRKKGRRKNVKTVMPVNKRTYRRRWRRNAQSIANEFSGYDFQSDVSRFMEYYLATRDNRYLLRAYNSLKIYAEQSHTSMNGSALEKLVLSLRRASITKDSLVLFERSRDPRNLMAQILVYTRGDYKGKESESFCRRLNRLLRAYYIDVKKSGESPKAKSYVKAR